MDYPSIFKEYNIDCEIVFHDNEYYFKACDIGNILNVKNIHNMNVSTQHKRKLKCATNGGMQTILFFTEEGVKQVLRKTRKSNVHILARAFDMKITDNIVMCAEAQTIKQIKDVFESEEMIEQYNVDRYLIDLYFPKYKIAVECDECHHKYKHEYDINRETIIRSKLNCSFVRYKPYTIDFSIGSVIKEIYSHIQAYNLITIQKKCINMITCSDDVNTNLFRLCGAVQDFIYSLYTPTDMTHEQILSSKEFRRLCKISRDIVSEQ